MTLFRKREDKEYQIKKLVEELEEAKKLTPSIGEFFAEQDYSCLWEDDPPDTGLIKFLPIANFAIGIILIIIILKIK